MSTLSARNLEPILAVVAKLAAPFDLTTMLAEVVDAAKQVLHVSRGTVWLYDAKTDELVLRFLEWRFLGAPAQGAGADADTWFLTTRDRNANNLGRVLVSDAFDAELGFDLDLPLAPPSAPCAAEAAPAAFRETRDPTAFELAFETGYLERVGLRA